MISISHKAIHRKLVFRISVSKLDAIIKKYFYA